MAKFQPDEDLVRKLSGLLTETGLTEIEYEANGQRIRVARASAVSAPLAVAAPAGRPAEAATETTPSDAIPEGAVLSPMVGTAYAAPEPGGKPFVAVGDKVTEGQTLLIIEAMKVMNPIPSPKAGRLASILFEDGQPVEYGEPLLIVE